MATITAEPAAAQTARNLICNGCVDGKDIRKKTIRANNIRNNAVKGSKVRNNSLTGADIKDGTIKLKDLSPGVVDAIMNPTSITEVLVTFDDPAQGMADSLRITVEGVDLDNAAGVTATLGGQGALQVVSAGGGEILALCPAPDQICQEGEFQLSVSVQPAAGAPATLTHDLTIGAALRVSDEFVASTFGTNNRTVLTPMGSTSRQFCILSEVMIEETDEENEWASCSIFDSGGEWVLRAQVALPPPDDAEALCRARCVTF